MIQGVIHTTDVRKLVAESKKPWVRGHQGDLHRGEVDGHRVFVKAATGNLLSASAKRWMLHREYRVYCRLQGIRGVPRCFGFYEGRYLVTEAIEGRTLRNATVANRQSFYEQLLETLEAMHSRNVAHGDLMRRDNIIVDEQERPVLVDFGVATVYRPGLHPLNHLAYRFFRQHDVNAWLKHKYDGQWERMTPEDALRHRRLLMDDLARRIKRAWRTVRRGH